MDRSDIAESQKSPAENVDIEDYRINKQAVQNEQTEMLAVLIICIAPKLSKQKSFQIIQNTTPLLLVISDAGYGHINEFYHIRANVTINNKKQATCLPHQISLSGKVHISA